MRILVTNDDGIAAPGLAVAEEIAAALGTEVWTVAPAFEQSGVSHAISYVRPMRLEELGPRRIAVEGTPADCVIAALDHLLPAPPDLVLSGVNRGRNVAEDVLVSGTVGGAMEAALHGVRAIALSQMHGPVNRALPDLFEAARAHGAAAVKALLDHAPWPDEARRPFYNVNFPPVAAADAKPPVATRQGLGGRPIFGATPQTAPNGRTYLWLRHASPADLPEGSDAALTLAGHITVTPLHADLTAHDLVDDLARALG